MIFGVVELWKLLDESKCVYIMWRALLSVPDIPVKLINLLIPVKVKLYFFDYIELTQGYPVSSEHGCETCHGSEACKQ